METKIPTPNPKNVCPLCKVPLQERYGALKIDPLGNRGPSIEKYCPQCGRTM